MNGALALLLLLTTAVAAVAETPTKEDGRMDTFREAKFGMFIHWGLYAIPARGEGVINKEKIPVEEYARFAKRFNPAELKQVGVDYLSYADRQIPDRPQWRDWETCMTLNGSWGYNKNDDKWKSPAVLIGQILDTLKELDPAWQLETVHWRQVGEEKERRAGRRAL